MSDKAPRYVMPEMCDTCIFRPGNKMDLRPGRLLDLTSECDRKDTNVVCHKSASLMGELDDDYFCRGSVDRRPGQMARIIFRLEHFEKKRLEE